MHVVSQEKIKSSTAQAAKFESDVDLRLFFRSFLDFGKSWKLRKQFRLADGGVARCRQVSGRHEPIAEDLVRGRLRLRPGGERHAGRLLQVCDEVGQPRCVSYANWNSEPKVEAALLFGEPEVALFGV